jgi:signal transduction histidine kinase
MPRLPRPSRLPQPVAVRRSRRDRKDRKDRKDRRPLSASGAAGARRGGRIVGALRQIPVDVWPVLLALILYAVAWPVFHLTHSVHAAIVPLLAATGTWPVAAVRRYPFPAWATVAATCLVSVPFHDNPGYALSWPVPLHLALAVTLAAVVLRGTAGQVAVAVAGTVLLMLANPAEVIIGWIVGAGVWSAFFLLLRWLLASRRQARTEAGRATEQSALRVMAEERNGLARDLHDVVAHEMSMIVVQAQSAPYRLTGVTPAVHAEFDSIADTAREALNQVRELLGVLRTDAEQGTTTPVGISQIEPTLTAARRAGVDVTWTVDGDPGTVSQTSGVVLQRVLQECLSNAGRHAPGGTVVVRLEISPTWASLTVDNGPAAPGALVPPEHSGGSGIPGMAARVQAVGGTFSALPAADGGFSVAAGVPVRAH